MSNVDDKISLLKDRGFEAGPYGTNAGETKRAVTEALMQAKNEYFNNDQLLNSVAKNSEEANQLKAMNEKIISKLPQMKAQLEASKEAINTVLENAYDFSKANKPEDVNKAKQIAAGDYEMINQDGELAYKLPNGDTISLEGFRSMVDNIQLPANKEMNELMVNNFNLKDKVGKLGQTVDLDKEQAMFKQMITDPTDTNGNRNPKVVTERLKSFLNDFDFEDTFGKRAVARLTEEVSKGNFENAVNALSEWNRGKQEEIIKEAQAPQVDMESEKTPTLEDDNKSGVREYFDYVYGTGEDTRWQDVPEERKKQIREEFNKDNTENPNKAKFLINKYL